MHTSSGPHENHMIQNSEGSPFQLPWKSSFRDQDDFIYTVKLLQKSLGESAIKRPRPPHPIELLSKVFPFHKENVLELVLKGCSGDVVQAIECILAGKNRSRELPALVKPVNSSLPSMSLSSRFPSIACNQWKPGLLQTMPTPTPLTSLNGVTKVTSLPMPAMGVFATQTHSSLRFPSHLRSHPAHAHTSEGKPGDFNRLSRRSPTVLHSYSTSHSVCGDHKSTGCFRCGAKPRTGDRFCATCGTDLNHQRGQ